MKLNKKQVINYLKRKLRQIDNSGGFYEYQNEYSTIKNTIIILEREL